MDIRIFVDFLICMAGLAIGWYAGEAIGRFRTKRMYERIAMKYCESPFKKDFLKEDK